MYLDSNYNFELTWNVWNGVGTTLTQSPGNHILRKNFTIPNANLTNNYVVTFKLENNESTKTTHMLGCQIKYSLA